MLLIQLYIQIEAAHDTIDELGKLGLVQFRDVGFFFIILQKSFLYLLYFFNSLILMLMHFKEILLMKLNVLMKWKENFVILKKN